MEKRDLVELSAILGEGNVSANAASLKPYFREVVPGARLAVARPQNHQDLGIAANYAYDNDIEIFTHRRGHLPEAILHSEGVLFDLAGIDRINRIDERNLLAFIEYGVTFEQMKEELDKQNLRLLMPAAATSSSVVRSYVDRDVIIANGATRPYQLTIFHAILADGRIWMSGNDQMTPEGHSEFREDIGPMYSYFFHASEDIFGMPYAAKVFLYRRWETREVTAFGFTDLEDAVSAASLASRGDQVFECVVADNVYLGVLLSDNRADAEALAEGLPPWNVVYGFENHPKLVDVWKRQTSQIALDRDGKEVGELAGKMAEKFEWPWYIRDRDYYRGFTETIDYYALGGKVGKLFESTASAVGELETGRVAIPSYYGGAFYCETDIYCEENDDPVHDRWLEAYRGLLSLGAHLGRPRGEVAKIIYEKMDPENIRMIKNLKKVLDPKGLLNRGQLLEGV